MDNYKDVIHGNYLWPSQRVLAELARLEQSTRSGCLVAALADTDWIKETEEKLASRLEQAQIALLLASGPVEVCRIYDYAPHGLELLLLGPKPQTIEQATRCVALNLDWYLNEPQPLFRWEWVKKLFAVLLLAYCTLSWLLSFTVAASFVPGIIYQSLLVGIVVWGAYSGDDMRYRWIRALRRYMEGVYAEQCLEIATPAAPSALALPEAWKQPPPDETRAPDPWNNPRK
jgi:hypothetical protein